MEKEKTERTTVQRNAGHPWDGNKRPGFDLLRVQADTQEEMNALVVAAEKKFWRPWLIGINDATGLPGGAMYKPCDIKHDWHDSPEKPHPGCPRAAPQETAQEAPPPEKVDPARTPRRGP